MHTTPAVAFLETRQSTLRALEGARPHDPVRKAPPAPPATRRAPRSDLRIARIIHSIRRTRSRPTPT
jgi:hypothetical protein